MSIVMTMFWPDATADQYDALKKDVNWEGDIPKGAILHIAAFDEQGLHVTDVWESADDFNAFVNDRLMPAVKSHNIPGEPKVEIRQVHSLFTPGV